MSFWGYPPIVFINFFSTYLTFFRSRLVSEKIPCGCNSSYSFPPIIFKLSILDLHGLKLCVWFWGHPPIIFYQLSSTFFDLVFFPGPISIGIDTLWAQLLLEFFTNHFETMHICSTWTEDVRVVLGLSTYHTDLKVSTLY